jgi:hypothetical protein
VDHALPMLNGNVFVVVNAPTAVINLLDKLKEGTYKPALIVVILPVCVIVILISDMGFFNWLRNILAREVSFAFIPVEAMSVVVFSLLAEFTSGYAAAGAMLESGTLTVFQIVLALLIGNIVAVPVRALRHQMPYYMGIFGPKLGTRLVIISQFFRVTSLIVSGVAYVLIALPLA